MFLTILVISRDVLIVVIAWMLHLAYGKTRFKPTVWGKITTGTELVTIGIVLLCNHLQREPLIVHVAIAATLTMVLVSGFHYLWRKHSSHVTAVTSAWTCAPASVPEKGSRHPLAARPPEGLRSRRSPASR